MKAHNKCTLLYKLLDNGAFNRQISCVLPLGYKGHTNSQSLNRFVDWFPYRHARQQEERAKRGNGSETEVDVEFSALHPLTSTNCSDLKSSNCD